MGGEEVFCVWLVCFFFFYTKLDTKLFVFISHVTVLVKYQRR